MQDLHFCPHCGAALQEGDQFCTACGFALTNLQQPAAAPKPQPQTPEAHPPVAQPATKAEPTNPSAVNPVVWVIVLLLIGGPIGWYFWQKDKDKSLSGYFTSGNNDYGLNDPKKSDPDEYKQDVNPVIPDIKIPGSFSQKDYVGEWRIFEATQDGELRPEEGRPEDDLIIVYENGRLYMYGRNEEADKYKIQIQCGDPVGHVLSCRVREEADSPWMTITMEMSQDKDYLTMTAIPDEPTEKMIIKMRRL